ncbi:sigma-70 family RNA polymerase sigma factor [Fulvivirgaceae bacterium PWU4]|uniref:Sigma-70 family RNA polymerase sigma factor n=1 Tax=Chryseosolibacter histidini TaxID=2782349 RepID=A0AAP2DII6_9BACT|nr:sigma-70 family RNA polymerase sigma factor [Chryseosolibacter histidini]MBT1696013.1 sigma-70 family RNA polymerase sigma factor [Chryseosolibacter histidini]
MDEALTTLKTDSPSKKVIQTVKDYGNRLFGFIRGRVKTDEDAEDILQDVWYQLSHAVNAEDIGQMSGWLFKVARNKIIDKHRKKSTVSLDDFSADTEEGEYFYKDILLMNDTDPEEEYLREVFWIELFSALDELPVNQRNVFVWNELEDMTMQEIADKTGEKLKTIISRKRYAVKHLREKLESLYNDLLNY